MSPHSALKQRPARLASLVRWEFIRRGERLTCQIDRQPESGDFALAIVPHRRLHWASIETYRAVAEAFRRHAAVVSQLRASGWKLVSYSR